MEAKRPSLDSSDPPLPLPTLSWVRLVPWLCDREREKKQHAAKSITNMASLGTARKQAISNRRLWCLSPEISIAVVGMGSQMLTHQEETQSEAQADYPRNLS